MHHDIIERVIELAHVHKLKDTQDLLDQTGWCFTAQHGAAVLDLVQKYCPIADKPTPQAAHSSPFTSAPLEMGRKTPASAATNEPNRRTRAAPTCSVCNIQGHRSKWHITSSVHNEVACSLYTRSDSE